MAVMVKTLKLQNKAIIKMMKTQSDGNEILDPSNQLKYSNKVQISKLPSLK